MVASTPCVSCGSTTSPRYVCDECGRTFCLGDEERAIIEYERVYGVPFKRDEVRVVCDDCYAKVKP